MEKHKIVIIGAGPGGLNCAKVLADNGEDFILLEKESRTKRKICTGLWIFNKRAGNYNLPEEVFQKKFSAIRFKTKRKSVDMNYKRPFIATLRREKLSEWMLSLIPEKEERVRFNAPVREIAENYVVAGGQKIYFDYLVGADGGNSAVRKFLKLKTEKVGVAVQYWIPGNYQELEIHFDSKRFGPWYAWQAPHNDSVSVGSGSDPKVLPTAKVKENLTKWCGENDLDIGGLNLEGALMNTDYRGHKFNNIFLVGDAAGLVSTLTGEGIYHAMASGEDVARMIINKKHQPILINEILRVRKIHNILLALLSLNNYVTDIIYNFLISLLKSEALKRYFIEFI